MSSEATYQQGPGSQPLFVKEQDIEAALVEKLRSLKYTERADIRDRTSLEANFRQKFEALNRVRLTDTEFKRLLEELTIPDVFTAARVLREKNDFTRDDGTPLTYTLVDIRDDFEVVQQLRLNTDYSHHRYDVLLLINGVPVVQIELKGLNVVPRRAMEQIVDYKNDPGNGYIVNTHSHKKVSYYESDELGRDGQELFDNVFEKIKAKYNFALHA